MLRTVHRSGLWESSCAWFSLAPLLARPPGPDISVHSCPQSADEHATWKYRSAARDGPKFAEIAPYRVEHGPNFGRPLNFAASGLALAELGVKLHVATGDIGLT